VANARNTVDRITAPARQSVEPTLQRVGGIAGGATATLGDVAAAHGDLLSPGHVVGTTLGLAGNTLATAGSVGAAASHQLLSPAGAVGAATGTIAPRTAQATPRTPTAGQAPPARRPDAPAGGSGWVLASTGSPVTRAPLQIAAAPQRTLLPPLTAHGALVPVAHLHGGIGSLLAALAATAAFRSESSLSDLLGSAAGAFERRAPAEIPRQRGPAPWLPNSGLTGGSSTGGTGLLLLLLVALAGALIWAAPRLGRWLRPTPDLARLHPTFALELPG
jgi:hypothetical protein